MPGQAGGVGAWIQGPGCFVLTITLHDCCKREINHMKKLSSSDLNFMGQSTTTSVLTV